VSKEYVIKTMSGVRLGFEKFEDDRPFIELVRRVNMDDS
jgi:hypothetical protein